MLEKNNEQPDTKKTLMNSLERLNRRAYLLEDLNNLSCQLLMKFENPYPESNEKIKGDEKGILLNKKPNLIDLFDEVADSMENSIQSIRDNLEKILNMIK